MSIIDKINALFSAHRYRLFRQVFYTTMSALCFLVVIATLGALFVLHNPTPFIVLLLVLALLGMGYLLVTIWRSIL